MTSRAPVTMTALDAFLNGTPQLYVDHRDGNVYRATLVKRSRLVITEFRGEVIRDQIIGERAARVFYLDIEARARGI